MSVEISNVKSKIKNQKRQGFFVCKEIRICARIS